MKYSNIVCSSLNYSANRNGLIFPLFVGVEIEFLLVPVEGKFVVHTVKEGGARKRLAILQGLAHPDDKNIVLGDLLAVAPVQMLIGVFSDGLFAQVYKIFFIHGIPPRYKIYRSTQPDLSQEKACNCGHDRPNQLFHKIVPALSGFSFQRRDLAVQPVNGIRDLFLLVGHNLHGGRKPGYGLGGCFHLIQPVAVGFRPLFHGGQSLLMF
nr:MAG TPA: hypothetical protein [Caudoviricetes sp.]